MTDTAKVYQCPYRFVRNVTGFSKTWDERLTYLGRSAHFPRKHLVNWDGVFQNLGRMADYLGRMTCFHLKVLGKTSELPFFSPDPPLWVLFGSSETPLWVLGKTSEPEVAKRFNGGIIRVAWR